MGRVAFAQVTMNRTQIESYAPGMAAMTILGVPSPSVFLFLHRHFLEGVISTGIKGVGPARNRARGISNRS